MGKYLMASSKREQVPEMTEFVPCWICKKITTKNAPICIVCALNVDDINELKIIKKTSTLMK